MAQKQYNTVPSARTQRPSRKDSSSRVYVASPLSTYQTDRYEAMVSRIRSHAPDADILPARDLFTGNADWRRNWPVILPMLDAVVFFADEDGCIGAGTEQEIADAQLTGIPVFFLTPPPFDRLVSCDESGAVEFWPVPGWPRQTQRVCYSISADDALALLSAHGIGGG